MAKLYFKYGAMGSSKSAQALITKFNYEELGMSVWLIKPSIDDRDGADIVRSRIGLQAVAQVITPEQSIREAYFAAGRHDVIISDESQFFTPEQIEELRVLVYMIPTLLAVFGLQYIRREDDPVINFAANMSVISSGIYVISMFTSAIMIGRLPIYFSLYNYILLPWEITHIFTRRSARVITWATVGFYLLYNYYQVAIAYGQAFTLGFFSL